MRECICADSTSVLLSASRISRIHLPLPICLRSFTLCSTTPHSFLFVCLHPILRLCSRPADNKLTFRLCRRPPCSLPSSHLTSRRSSSQTLSHPCRIITRVRPVLSTHPPNTVGPPSSQPNHARTFAGQCTPQAVSGYRMLLNCGPVREMGMRMLFPFNIKPKNGRPTSYDAHVKSVHTLLGIVRSDACAQAYCLADRRAVRCRPACAFLAPSRCGVAYNYP